MVRVESRVLQTTWWSCWLHYSSDKKNSYCSLLWHYSSLFWISLLVFHVHCLVGSIWFDTYLNIMEWFQTRLCRMLQLGMKVVEKRKARRTFCRDYRIVIVSDAQVINMTAPVLLLRPFACFFHLQNVNYIKITTLYQFSARAPLLTWFDRN